MRRFSVFGLLTVVVLLIGMVSPVAYGQGVTPTATAGHAADTANRQAAAQAPPGRAGPARALQEMP